MATNASARPLPLVDPPLRTALVDCEQLRLVTSLAIEIVRGETPNPLFRAVMDASCAGFIIVSAERRILCANRAMAELTGYTVEELIALPSS